MDTLKELGIPAYGRRYKVMTAINKLNSSRQKSTSHNTLEDIDEVENEVSILKQSNVILSFFLIIEYFYLFYFFKKCSNQFQKGRSQK